MKIICEAGCNWTKFEDMLDMIIKAKEVGCFAVKFQLFTKEMAREAEIPEYLALPKEQAQVLFEFGKAEGIEVFFTPMYAEIVPFLEEIGVNYYKIRFKDRYNSKLLHKIMDLNKPTFISSDRQRTAWTKDILHLFCIPKYPAKWGDYYGELIIWQRGDGFYDFDGISDHTPDTWMLERALDEKEHEWYNKFEYWEKHIKLDGTTPLEDKWSVSFSELEEVLQ